MATVEPFPNKRVRRRKRTDPLIPLNEVTMGEVVRRLEGVENSSREMGSKLDKLMSRFTLFFGLGIGAMAASGLISDGAKELILKIVGAF